MRRCFIQSWALFLCLAHLNSAGAATPVGPTREIACAPTNPAVVLALIQNKVWITTDGGETWKRVASIGGLFPADEQSQAEDKTESDFISGDEEYDSGSDDEISEYEPRRIEWESETIFAPSVISTVEPSVSTETHLAVSDDGYWAVGIGGHILLGDSDHVVRRIDSVPIMGLVFDAEGRLWITYDDTLSLFGKPDEWSFEPKKWRIPGASVPTIGSEGTGEILIPASEGVWVVNTGESELGYETMLVRLGHVNAVTKLPGSDSMYISSRGKIVFYRDEKLRETLPTPPISADRIAIDEKHRVLIRSRAGEWFELRSGSWRPIRALCLAMDAKQRVWIGTELGPSRLEASESYRKFFVPVDVLAIQSKALSKLDLSPGPPPKCRRFPINPLPKAQLFFGLDQDLATRFDTELVPHYVPYSAHRRSEIYFGVQLTWSLSPVDPSTCYIERRNWKRRQMERVAGVQTLALMRQRLLNTRTQNSDVLEATELVIRKKQNEELIRIVTEVQSWEERKE